MAVIFTLVFSQSFCDCIFDGFKHCLRQKATSARHGRPTYPDWRLSGGRYFSYCTARSGCCMLRQWLRLAS